LFASIVRVEYKRDTRPVPVQFLDIQRIILIVGSGPRCCFAEISRCIIGLAGIGWWQQDTDNVIRKKGGRDAWQVSPRQEREAIRGAEGQGDVERAGGEDRELARRFPPRRRKVAFIILPILIQAGRHNGTEEGGWS